MNRTQAQVIALSSTHRVRRRTSVTDRLIAAFRAGWDARAEHDARPAGEQARLWLAPPAEGAPTANTAA